VLATLAEKLRSAEIEIGELPKLRLDRPRLAELFTLLLDNACRHGDSGQPVRIQVRGVLEAGVAHLEIIDHGPGIPAEYRERVFRVFERLKNHHDGNGSGLAIVRRIVESVGGRAWITETPGGGCTVNCEIPSGVEPR
jgi:signal transduction histidine kinase